jgi:hypothetical protein
MATPRRRSRSTKQREDGKQREDERKDATTINDHNEIKK